MLQVNESNGNTHNMRLVNTKLLTKWVAENGPLAKEKLAVASEVSYSLLDKVVLGIHTPKLENCIKIAQATGIPLDALFPEVRKTA